MAGGEEKQIYEFTLSARRLHKDQLDREAPLL